MSAPQMRPTVLVGVDGSAMAEKAVRWGAAEAARQGIPLRLVTAIGRAVDDLPGRHDHYQDALLEHVRGRLTFAAEEAARQAPGIEIEQELVVGSPLSVLLAESRRARLVVIGDRGLSRIEGLMAGSVAVALATRSSCPVVIVRGDERAPADLAALPVVVGIDANPAAEAAIAFAFDAAATRQVPLVALHTWSDLAFNSAMAGVVLDWPAIEVEEAERLSERLAGWSEKYPGVPVERVVTRESPAASLLTWTDRAQLVVVGSRGHGEFAGLVLGSVSNALLHRSACSVAVVRDMAEVPA